MKLLQLLCLCLFTDDVVSKPIESKPSDNKPLAKQTDNNTPTIKGPGPKIKTRDGSKVLVTELLKSREGDYAYIILTTELLAIVQRNLDFHVGCLKKLWPGCVASVEAL